MSEDSLAELAMWLAEPLPADVIESVTRLRTAEGVRKVCLMPDVHLAVDVCVGAVVGAEQLVYPQAVGGDIGCGMAALPFSLEAAVLESERAAGAVLAGLYRCVPSNKHRQPQSLPLALSPSELSDLRLATIAQRDGAVQHGTLGRGNHFLELQADQGGQLWALVHSGSRGLGQAIAAHHLARGTSQSGGLIGLDLATDAGAAYLHDVQWARRYAAENRLAMLRAVADLMRRLFGAEADWSELIHVDHNHVQRETHAGQTLYVHRKGAQSARDGEAGVIPGSMGAATFHTVGRGCAAALMSCSHGAGRRMSRSAARQAIPTSTFKRQVGRLWYDRRRIEALRDEAPGAYKDVRAVMRGQRELAKVVRELRPVLNYKGA